MAVFIHWVQAAKEPETNFIKYVQGELKISLGSP